MSEFWIFFEIGLKHVLNFSAYDHVLFLVALTVPYFFKDWKRLLILISIFTLGHSVALLLSVFGVVVIKESTIEFLIPITIFVMAMFNIFTAGKSSKQGAIGTIGFVTLFFGIIHGLGFASYIKIFLGGAQQSKLLPLFEFAVGIEAAQIIVVIIILVLSYTVQNFFRFSRRDWILVMSSFVAGVVLPMIVQNEIWNR